MGRVSCSVLDRPKERIFNKMATKGVVKFFNVCNNQQKEIDTQIKSVGSSERKKDKILSSINKSSFLNKLKEENDFSSDDDKNKQSNDQKPAWNVLRDDFIMGGNIKDWDKNEDVSE